MRTRATFKEDLLFDKVQGGEISIVFSWFEGLPSGSTFRLDFMMLISFLCDLFFDKAWGGEFLIMILWFEGLPSGSTFRLNFMMLSSSLRIQNEFAHTRTYLFIFLVVLTGISHGWPCPVTMIQYCEWTYPAIAHHCNFTTLQCIWQMRVD